MPSPYPLCSLVIICPECSEILLNEETNDRDEMYTLLDNFDSLAAHLILDEHMELHKPLPGGLTHSIGEIMDRSAEEIFRAATVKPTVRAEGAP